jgi:hypothetical protein
MTSENMFLAQPGETAPGRESIKIAVFGSREGIQEIVHQLHNARIREATTWSPYIPTPEPGVFVKMNVHYRRTT